MKGKFYDVTVWGRENSITRSIKGKPLYSATIHAMNQKSAKEHAWDCMRKEVEQGKWLRRTDVRIECEDHYTDMRRVQRICGMIDEANGGKFMR